MLTLGRIKRFLVFEQCSEFALPSFFIFLLEGESKGGSRRAGGNLFGVDESTVIIFNPAMSANDKDEKKDDDAKVKPLDARDIEILKTYVRSCPALALALALEQLPF